MLYILVLALTLALSLGTVIPSTEGGVAQPDQTTDASAIAGTESLDEESWFVDNEADKGFEIKWTADDLGREDGLDGEVTDGGSDAGDVETYAEDEEEQDIEVEGTDNSGSYTPTYTGYSSGAQAFIEACREELRQWDAGNRDRAYYVQPYVANVDDYHGGFCGMFIGVASAEIGSDAIHWNGDCIPSDPTTPSNYHKWYMEHPEAGTITDNDGSTMPKPGDLVLMWDGAHVEMVEQIDEDGTGWWGISGGGSVDHTHHSPDDGCSTWYITPNWTLLGFDS